MSGRQMPRTIDEGNEEKTEYEHSEPGQERPVVRHEETLRQDPSGASKMPVAPLALTAPIFPPGLYPTALYGLLS